MKSTTICKLWLLICAAAPPLVAFVLAADQRNDEETAAAGLRRPAPTQSDIREGQLAVRAWCSLCHGFDGKGGRGPDLTRGVFRWGNSDKAIFNNIKQGIPGTDMVGWPDFEDQSVWRIIAYIRAHENRPGVEHVRGDPLAGQRLYDEHNCASCHWSGRHGGARGPDLTQSNASLDYVRKALLEPERNVYPGNAEPRYAHHKYQKATVVTRSGRVYAGRWVNENTDHVLFLDDEENYHTFTKDEIEEIGKPEVSQMSSFRDVLTEQQLTDLIAYVVSLRTPVQKEE